LNQSFGDFDTRGDASQDDTQSVVKDFTERIKYICHVINCGRRFARNSGVSSTSARQAVMMVLAGICRYFLNYGFHRSYAIAGFTGHVSIAAAECV
jgi:hypothetical protein